MNSLDAIDRFLEPLAKTVLPFTDFDAAVARLDPSVPTAIYLPSGVYLTRGFRVPKKCAIIGERGGTSIIRTMPNVGSSGMNYPHLRMIQANAQDEWSDAFFMRDVILDGNIEHQDEFDVNGNFKVEPLVMQTVVASVERVEVWGFGSNGSAEGYIRNGQPVGSGLEAFPLSLATFANGNPEQYFPNFQSPRFLNEAQTFLRVANCKVIGGRYKGAGYATAIMVVTNHAGDRQPVGTRSSMAAVVSNNYVNVGHSIGYGCAGSEMVRFEGNISEGTKCGVNIDTGAISRVEIVGNQFLNVAQGVSLQASGRANRIDRNIIVMGPPAVNPVNNVVEPYYTVHTKYQNDSTADSNTYVVRSLLSEHPIGIPETNAKVILIGGDDRTAEIEFLKKINAQLVESANLHQQRAGVLESGIKAFDKNSRTAKTAREILVGLVS